jgi:tetratricopeptide (TPR) repeat protein
MNSDYEMSPEYKKMKEKILASSRKNDGKAKEFVKIGIKEAKKNRTRNAFDAFEVAKNLNPKLYSAWLYLGNLQEHYGFTIEAEISYAKAASLPDDKHNNEAAKMKYQELRMKETVRQAEITLKEAKIIPETAPPPRARPDLSREDGLANVKRLMGMSIEEREILNERHKFTAIVFDELFANEAMGKGDNKVVRMNEEKWYRLVQELISRGRRDAAAENMVYCVRENPSNIEHWKELIDLLDEINDSGMREAAEEAYQCVLKGEEFEKYLWRRMYAEPPSEKADIKGKARPFNEKVYKRKVVDGQKLMNSKRFKDAATILRQAVALAPDKYEANYVLGLVYFYMQNIDDAKSHLLKAFEANPDSSNVGIILSQIYGSTQEFDKAKEVLDKLLEYPKYTDEARVILSMVLTMMKDHEAALEQYEMASKYASDNPQFFEAYGASLIALDRYKEAESVLVKARSMKESVTTLTMLADVQLKLEKKKDAENSAKRALKRRDDDLDSNLRLANVLLKLGKVDDTEIILNSVPKQEPKNIDVQLLLAFCHFEKREYNRARIVSKQILEISPVLGDSMVAHLRWIIVVPRRKSSRRLARQYL